MNEEEELKEEVDRYERQNQEAYDLEIENEIKRKREAEEKYKQLPLFTRLNDAIEGKLDQFGQFISEAAQDKPGITDDIVRGGLQGLQFVGNLPIIKQLGQAEEAIVGGVRNLAERQDLIDPRSFTYSTRIGLGFVADKGIRKVVKAGKVAYKVQKGKDRLAEIARKRMPTTQFAQEATAMYKPKQVIASSVDPGRNPFDPRVTGGIKALKEKLQVHTVVDRFQNDLPTAKDVDPFLSPSANIAITKSLKEMPAYRSAAPGSPAIFNYDVFRDFLRGAKVAGFKVSGRDYLATFQSGFTGGGAGKGVNFGVFSKNEVTRLKNVFGPSLEALGLAKNAVQVHHMAALKTIMGIHDGLGIGSPLFNKVNETIMDQLQPIIRRGTPIGGGLGNMETNLLGVISGGRKIGNTVISDTPHALAHRFLTGRVGAAGEKFFTKTVRKNMQSSKAYRIKKAKELGKIIEEANKIVIQAQDVYETLFAQGTGIDFGEVMRVMLKLDDQGYLKGITKGYQTSAVAELIEDINSVLEVQQFTLPGVNLGTADMLGLFDPLDYKAKALREAIKSGGTISENHRAFKAVLGKSYDSDTPQLSLFNDEQISDLVSDFKLYKKQKRIEAKTRRNQQKYFDDPNVYRNLIIDE